MKKRMLSLLLIVGLMASLMAGCQKTNGDTESEQDTGYAYDQEDNIIDDNYRNYYEIFVYSFCDSDGDGIGDLQGVIQKLDYIADMGFNGIWMMPIHPSPTYHKYDVTDYYAIDPQYGTLEDFETLIAECHKRGINVVMDFVVNHSASAHPWFTQACDYLRSLEQGAEPSAEECKYFGYYHFSKEKKNNTYYKVSGTNWYYEGAFWSGMPDLNYESKELCKEFEDICKFWVEKGVDGFRVDAAMHIVENDTEENNKILNWIYTTCTSLNPDFYMVSEVWTDISAFRKYYGSLTPSIFNFDAALNTGVIMKAAKGYMTAGTFFDELLSYDKNFSKYNENYIDAVFLSNHDVARLSEACVNNEKTIKMSMGLMSMMNGSIYVYYGDEIGLPGTSDKDENKRLPMIWSDRTDEGETIGPIGCSIPRSNFAGVEQQLEDETSLLNYFKRALQLRNENPEIARGEIKKVDSLCTDQYGVMTKTYEGSTIAIAINNKDEAVQITLTDTELAEMNIRGYLTIDGEVITLKDGVLTLPPKSICILK